MTDASVGLRHAHDLHGSEHLFIKIDCGSGAFHHQIGRNVVIALRNWFCFRHKILLVKVVSARSRDSHSVQMADRAPWTRALPSIRFRQKRHQSEKEWEPFDFGCRLEHGVDLNSFPARRIEELWGLLPGRTLTVSLPRSAHQGS